MWSIFLKQWSFSPDMLKVISEQRANTEKMIQGLFENIYDTNIYSDIEVIVGLFALEGRLIKMVV